MSSNDLPQNKSEGSLSTAASSSALSNAASSVARSSVILSTDFERPLAREGDVVVIAQGQDDYAIGIVKIPKDEIDGKPDKALKNQYTSGEVAQVENVFTGEIENCLIDETCLIYRHFSRSEMVQRFINKHPEDLNLKKLRVAEDSNSNLVGIVVDVKLCADVLILPDRNRVVRGLPERNWMRIDPFTPLSTFSFHNKFDNVIFYEGWFGKMTIINQHFDLSLIVGKETFKISLHKPNHPRPYNEIMIRPPVDKDKAFYAGEWVGVHLNDLIECLSWDRAIPQQLVAQHRRGENTLFDCKIEKITINSVCVLWTMSPNSAPRPSDVIEKNNLYKIIRINLQTPLAYSNRDRFKFLTHGVRPEQITSLEKWRSDLNDEFASKFSQINAKFYEPNSEPISKKAKSCESDVEMRNKLHNNLESADEKLGATFVGEVLRPYIVCDIQLMDGTIIHDMPSFELLSLSTCERALNEKQESRKQVKINQPLTPGMIVVKHDCNNMENMFGLLLQLNTNEKTCVVRWFTRRSNNECSRKKDETCNIAQLIKHGIYPREPIGHFVRSEKPRLGSTSPDNLICQIIENLEDGRQRVRFFDVFEDNLWPFEIKPFNLMSGYMMRGGGSSKLTQSIFASKDTTVVISKLLFLVDEQKKERKSLYLSFIDKYIHISPITFNYVNADAKEYAMGFLFKLLRREVQHGCKSDEPIEEMQVNGLCDIIILLINVLLELEHDQICRIFDVFLYVANLSDADAPRFPDIIDTFMTNPNAIAVLDGSQADEAFEMFENGVEFYENLMYFCDKVCANMQLKFNRFKCNLYLARHVCPMLLYIASRYQFDVKYFPAKSFDKREDGQMMKYVSNTLHNLHNLSRADEIDRRMFEFSKELNTAIVKTLQEDGKKDAKVMDGSKDGEKAENMEMNEAKECPQSVIKEYFRDDCERATSLPTLIYKTHLSDVERLVDEAEAGNAQFYLQMLNEMAFDMQAERSEYQQKEVEEEKRYFETFSKDFDMFSWGEQCLLLVCISSLQSLSSMGLISLQDNAHKLAEQLRPRNFFKRTAKDETTSRLTRTLLSLFGRRLHDAFFVISTYLYKHSKAADKTLKFLEFIRQRDEDKMQHPLMQTKEILVSLKAELPTLLTPVAAKLICSAGSFEVLEKCSQHHFLNQKPSTHNKGILKRLRHEYKLFEDLPAGIHVRTFSDRLDLFTAVISGPIGTPYDSTPFVLDFWLPDNYPNEPPKAHYIANHQGSKLNPNLYQEGKVCLSLLGTWSGQGVERWDPSKSSLFQVVVSVQGLILVKDPYFNEPGYELSRGQPQAMERSKNYSEVAAIASLEYLLNTYVKPRDYISQLIKSHVEREFLGLRERLMTIVEHDKAEYGTDWSAKFKTNILEKIKQMDEIIGPSAHSISTSAIISAQIGDSIEQKLLHDPEQVDLIVTKSKCPGTTSHPAHIIAHVTTKLANSS